MKKMITVHYNGPIRAKGGVCGPILTPYNEDIDTIFKMLTQGIKVVEVLKDKSEVILNLSNFNTDNEPVEETETKVVEDKVEPTPVVQPVQQNQHFNNKKKNKHNKYNNQYVQKVQEQVVTEEKPSEDTVVEPVQKETVNSVENDVIKVDEIEEI